MKMILFSTMLAGSLASGAPVKKETQADRIEKRLVHVETLLTTVLNAEKSRRAITTKYNQCNGMCNDEFPWRDAEDKSEEWKNDRDKCYRQCKLPDWILGE